MWDLRRVSCDSQVKAAIGAARTWEARVSIGLFALWVGWPAGLALYAVRTRSARHAPRRRAAVVIARRAPGTRSRDRS